MSLFAPDDRAAQTDESPPDGSFLSLARAQALARCCDAVADGRLDRAAVKIAMGELCQCAHRDGVLAEQLLIEIKHALADSARRRGLSSVEANAERTRFVTLAIDTYYSSL